jgi:hypothetical protein
MSEYVGRDEASWLAHLLFYMARFKIVYLPATQTLFLSIFSNICSSAVVVIKLVGLLFLYHKKYIIRSSARVAKESPKPAAVIAIRVRLFPRDCDNPHNPVKSRALNKPTALEQDGSHLRSDLRS